MTSNSNQVSLLESVSILLKKSEEISRLKQDSFNIFSILRKEYEEVKLHSAFIAELLNSRGSHEQGSTFCKLFVEQIGIKKFTVSQDVLAYREKYIGALGRIDILVENSDGQVIAIENKIYATDQKEQLSRYNKHLENSPKGSTLIYLTLDGKEASGFSTGDKEFDYITISYREDISAWLEKCLMASVEHPTLRETIKQYITLVKKLTNQLNQETESEMTNMLLDNYNAAAHIRDNLWKAEAVATKDFLLKIKETLGDKLSPDDGWVIKLNDNFQKKWFGGISITNAKQWPKETRLSFLGYPKIPWNASIWGFQCSIDPALFRKKLENSMSVIKLKYGKFEQSPDWVYYRFIFETPDERKRIFTDENCHREISEMLLETIKECSSSLKELHPIFKKVTGERVL